MANAYATIANGGRLHEPYIIEKVVDKDGETIYSVRQAGHRRRRWRGHRRRRQLRPAAGRRSPAPARPRSGSAARPPARPAPRPTRDDQVYSAWFVGYTPQLSTAVMYVRGKGNEQLDGWLPSYFGGDYPAETWTAIMKRDMDGVDGRGLPAAGVRRRRRSSFG